MTIYLDNSATTIASQKTVEIMTKYLIEDYGNPSSLHRMGFRAEKTLKEARKNIARTIGFSEKEVFFTSCGTESDNLAIFGVMPKDKRQNHIISTKVEHPAVLKALKELEKRGKKVTYLDVDKDCNVDLKGLEEAIDESTYLVSVMAVNNEVGTIMNLDMIKKIIDEKSNGKILLHSDAVQGYGKIHVEKLPVDLMSLSGHKVHCTKGIGAIGVRDKVNLNPIIFGGGQERGKRSGTENLPAIAAFGEVAKDIESSLDENILKGRKIKEKLKKGIESEIKDILINTPENSSEFILSISFLGTRGEVILHTLEEKGIMVSTGSACSSNSKSMSHVLKAMGRTNKEIEGAIRFSFSKYNTLEEMDIVIDEVKKTVGRFRKFGSFR